MSQPDANIILQTLAYPISITVIVGLVCLGILLRGWMRAIQKTQEAKLLDLQNFQRHLEGQMIQQSEVLGQRLEHWGRDVHAQLGGQAQQLRTVNDAVGTLKTALVVPHLRGRILGETTLERLLSDVLPPHAYGFQFEIGSARVDAVIRFPHIGLVCPIDSKFHFAAAQTLLEGHADEGVMKEARRQLAAALKTSARDVARKYVKPELGTTDFAYLFIPSEGVFLEILHDIELWQSLVDERVLVVSPHTLFIALQPLSHAIRYYEMSLGVDEKIRMLQGIDKQLTSFNEQFSEQLQRAARNIESSQKMLAILRDLSHSMKSPHLPAQQVESLHSPVADVDSQAVFGFSHPSEQKSASGVI
jgi:DNA recombination protein RmuC